MRYCKTELIRIQGSWVVAETSPNVFNILNEFLLSSPTHAMPPMPFQLVNAVLVKLASQPPVPLPVSGPPIRDQFLVSLYSSNNPICVKGWPLSKEYACE